jgi:hypothetical protein
VRGLNLAKSRGAKAEEASEEVDGTGKPDPNGMFADLGFAYNCYTDEMRCVSAGH